MWKIKDIFRKLFTKEDKQLSLINILVFYRYISFLVTLLVYYATAPQKQIVVKLAIMAGLVIAYTTMALLYLKIQDDKKNVIILSIVETIENSIFIIISGGFSSPFIWYFISTAFIIAVNVSNLLAVIYSAVYFITAACTSIFILASTENVEVIRLYLNIAISCVIIIFVILQLIQHIRKLEEKSKLLSSLNCELEEAKVKTENTLKYSIEIYETINLFHLNKDDNILHEITRHFSYLTGIQEVLFVRLTPKVGYGTYISNGLLDNEVTQIYTKSMELIERSTNVCDQMYCDFDERILSIHKVMYKGYPCGAFITLTDEKWIIHYPERRSEEDLLNQNYNSLSIFMKIAGVFLQKMELDEIEEQLLISEEQNRIANEIHDIVLQRLFAISCRLYVMGFSETKKTDKRTREELEEIKDSIDVTMKELREAIYSLSWEKQGEDSFKSKLIEYATGIKNMHGVDISIIFQGDMQKISINQKRGLYRVICEAMNNAIRHGKANNIEVKFFFEEDLLKIMITDDGEGFDYNSVKQKNERGLGLNNINRIIEMMNGQIEIRTGLSQGTEIILAIPCCTAA